MTRGLHRFLAGVALIGLSACDAVSCWWTDDPDREPWTAQELGRSYPTADGLFEVVLHSDGQWPLRSGVRRVQIEWSSATEGTDAPDTASAARPFTRDGTRVADTEPVATQLEPRLWRIDGLALDAAGQWIVPVILEHGELDDSIELHLDVAAD